MSRALEESRARWKHRANYFLGAMRHYRLHLDSMTAERDKALAEAELARAAYQKLAGYTEWKLLRETIDGLTTERDYWKERYTQLFDSRD